MKGKNMNSYDLARRLKTSNDFIAKKLDELINAKVFDDEITKNDNGYVITPLGFTFLKQMRWFSDLAMEAAK